jgi:hypothetical protein
MSNRLRARTANAVRHSLHYASAKHPLAEIIPDANWPGMWRVRWPDGSLSDMANLTRAKDAAFVIAQKGPPARDGQRLHWQTAPIGEPLRASVVRQKPPPILRTIAAAYWPVIRNTGKKLNVTLKRATATSISATVSS